MNNIIFFNLYSLAHQSNFLDKIFVFCAEYLPYIAVVLAIFFILYRNGIKINQNNLFKEIRKSFREFIFIFAPAVLGWGIVSFLKDIFAKPRPFIQFHNLVDPLFIHGGMDSFPSGHATFFGVLAVSIFFINKKVGFLFILFALIIGLTRIISGVHFPVDIICGYVLGVIIALIFNYFSKKSK